MAEHKTDTYRRIGQGFCGSVWASPALKPGDSAHKREDGGPGRSLYNDYVMHKRIIAASIDSQLPVRVPHCHRYVNADDDIWWDKEMARFPKPHQIPCNILLTERILPFPLSVRNHLIDRYCPEPLKPTIRDSEPDIDCIIRPCLGRRRLLRPSKCHAFKLRNYPLHMDQMEELGLDTGVYARVMAETLAFLFWRVGVDANDVEFVLAPPREMVSSQSLETAEVGSVGSVGCPVIIESDVLGPHILWILDFDCCRSMSMDEEGVKQAARAFLRNDPFCPRPGREDVRDQKMWNVFKEVFMKCSSELVNDGMEGLPALWVACVENGLDRVIEPPICPVEAHPV